MELAEEDMNNVFNLTESLRKPIGVRLAQRIKDLLNAKKTTEKQTDSALATKTPTINDEINEQKEVQPSIIETEVTGNIFLA